MECYDPFFSLAERESERERERERESFTAKPGVTTYKIGVCALTQTTGTKSVSTFADWGE